MSNRSKEDYLQKARNLWDVLNSVRDEFEKAGDFNACVYNILSEIDMALNLDTNFEKALSFKIQIMTNELGAYEETLEEAERMVRLVLNHPKYRKMLAVIQDKLRSLNL